MNKLLQLSKIDNVAVALQPLSKGEVVFGFKLKEDIPVAHKVALTTIKEKETIVKYGEAIGFATRDIAIGEHVHTHNCKTNLKGRIHYEYQPTKQKDVHIESPYQIHGYHRVNGHVGIRNELWIVVSVGCVNSIANQMVSTFRETHAFHDHYDGIFAITHPYGCSQMNDDHENTKKILQDIVKHPNAGGVLVLGLGCENNQLKDFEATLGSYDKERVKFLNSQDVEDEIEEGLTILEHLYDTMKLDTRTPCEFKDITIGLKCGGSDGFSGITANPLLGVFTDKLISYGGNAILSEVPEMFGAEHLLMKRAKDEKVFHSIVSMIQNFKQYFSDHKMEIYENPSPGNKLGGITTLEDKSLGCIQKSGTSIIQDVLDYAEPIRQQGLSLLYGPGNDLVATTALGASGAQLVLFTTGRGTPFGSFIPTLKISTNTKLAVKKTKWIDFDAGVLLEHGTIEELNNLFFQYICDIINGQYVQSEAYQDREIAIFKQGVTL